MTDYLIGNQEEMYQWAYRLTRNYDDAQDLLQSTLLCALKSVGMYTEENNISGWLYTIMRNIFFNTTRHSGRCCCMEKEDIERMMQLGENALNDNAEIAFDMSDIQRAIDTLDRPYKIPMSLYLSGYKYQGRDVGTMAVVSWTDRIKFLCLYICRGTSIRRLPRRWGFRWVR